VTVAYTSRVGEPGAGSPPDYLAGQDVSEPGLIRLRSIVYAPAGGAVLDASENSEKTGISPQQHDGLSRAFDDIEIHPGETVSVTYAIITGKHQDGDVILRTTPGTRPAEVSVGK
jgi:ABC-type branched-subunit amino acid transport system ATPase component